MGKTRFYEVTHHAEEVILTFPIEEQRALQFLQMREVIAIRGKVSRVGESVKIRTYPDGEKALATVHQVSPDGIPMKVQLEDGKVIELVGYLVQIVNLIAQIYKVVHRWIQALLSRFLFDQISLFWSFIFSL